MTVYRRPDPIPRPVCRPPINARTMRTADGLSQRSDDGSSLARNLFSLVITSEFPEGSTLPVEAELCDRFGVSRTALREAIKRLEAKGILNVRRRTGTLVASRRNWALLDVDLLRWQTEAGDFSVCENLWGALIALVPEASASGSFAQRLEYLEAAVGRVENPVLASVAFRAIQYFKADGRDWLMARLARTRLPASLVGG